MDAIPKECPACGCPHWSSSSTRTADSHSAWKDADGTWYNGPAHEETKRSCAHCAWSQLIVRKRGKLESVETLGNA